MSITIRIEGSARLRNRLRQGEARATAGLRKGLLAAALVVRNRAAELVAKGPKTGRIYRRGSITHRASAPDQAPASDTGHLLRSIGFEAQGSSAVVFAAAAYARALEFGTRFIAPRPFLRRALSERASEVREAVAKALEGLFR